MEDDDSNSSVEARFRLPQRFVGAEDNVWYDTAFCFNYYQDVDMEIYNNSDSQTICHIPQEH